MDLLNHVWHDLNNARIWKKQPDSIRNIYRDHYANYRRLLSQARAFNISNDALKVAYELSLDEPRKVAERLFMARLPFPKTWLEIDFHFKTNLSHQMTGAPNVGDDTPSRIGWLLQEDPADPLRWYSTTFVMLDTDRQPAWEPIRNEMKTSISLISFMLDTANRITPEKIGPIIGLDDSFLKRFVGIADGKDGNLSKIDSSKLPDRYWTSFRHVGWGYTGKTDGLTHNQAMRTIASPVALENSINIGLEPMLKQLIPHTDPGSLDEMIMNSAIESRGDMRLVVALLSLINEVPIIQTSERKNGTFIAGGKAHKFLRNTTVRINIPSKRPMTKVRAFLRNKIQYHKARHEVRGHWRTIIHQHTHTRKTRNNDGSIIEITFLAGEKERVWVNAHERGDASLGYVKHDYSVEKNGRSNKTST